MMYYYFLNTQFLFSKSHEYFRMRQGCGNMDEAPNTWSHCVTWLVLPNLGELGALHNPREAFISCSIQTRLPHPTSSSSCVSSIEHWRPQWLPFLLSLPASVPCKRNPRALISIPALPLLARWAVLSPTVQLLQLTCTVPSSSSSGLATIS